MDWNSLSGAQLARALKQHLEHLAVDEAERKLLVAVAAKALAARRGDEYLEVTFPDEYVLTVREAPPVDRELAEDWPEADRPMAQRPCSFALPGHQGLHLGPDVLDLDDYDLERPFEECPTRLPIAVADFSNWWVYLPQPDGTQALTLFDHSGNLGSGAMQSPGGLFLSRVATLLGERTQSPGSEVEEAAAGQVLERVQISGLFADTPAKHISAVIDDGQHAFLLGRTCLVVVDSRRPVEVVGKVDFGVKLSRRGARMLRIGDEIHVSHSDGSLLLDVSDPTAPRVQSSHVAKGDGRDYSVSLGDSELVHYYLSNSEGRGGAWYLRKGDEYLELDEEDEPVTGAAVIGQRLLTASQGSLSWWDISDSGQPARGNRVALNASQAQLVPLPELGVVLVTDDGPALRVIQLDSLRTTSPAWTLFKEEDALAWQLEGRRLHLLMRKKDVFTVAALELAADSPPRLLSRAVLDLPEGRRPWEPCKLAVEEDWIGALFRDGEWIRWEAPASQTSSG